MPSIQLPEIYCPFPTKISRYAQEAEMHTTEWVRAFGLVNSEKAWAKFKRARFAALSARAFPTADKEEVFIAADFNTWLFMLDDQNDEAKFGKTDFLDMIIHIITNILQGKPVSTSPEGESLAASFSDLIERMEPISTPGWRERFAQSMTDYLRACSWEGENRVAGRTPTVADYIAQRPYTGALYCDIELIEVLEKIYLPDSVRLHPDVQQLALSCNNVVCWANDLFSFAKESKHGDVHNLVLALKHERNYSLEEAIAETAKMHDEEVQKFINLSLHLPNFGPALNIELERYITILRSWMRANLDWSFGDTARYAMNIKEVANGKWALSTADSEEFV
ncbi:hypothetical protein LX64_00067 [Chitinophaga skermanii]|uniref:Terpene synthase n=1 Tax=Chitinophaga skermanii TaxID=331697 RepID=A0A327R2J5_9BACT|nr:hypothetical protein [Chitinophaga skermanii]RAJ10465.1 hypothetical protein LX64_00067 [Chitinophaga skermanii]